MREWHRYKPEFRKKAVERLKGCTNVEALARELKVSRGILYRWQDKAEGREKPKRPGPVVDTPAIAALKKEVVDLKLALGEKALEVDFFRGALQRVEDRQRKAGNSGDQASTITSRKRR
jgi:transposase-like protein